MAQADGTDRRLTREGLLRRAAVIGGAGVLAGLGAGRAGAAGVRTAAESGNLQVLDWSGYEVKDLWKQYAATHPDMKPKFTFMTNEANALGKMRAGVKPDVVHPCVGYVKDFADSGFVQPWSPALLKNLKNLNPAMVKAGQIGGKQWWIPADWGFSKPLYRTDKVTPRERSWSLMFDERYKGKIAWFDDLNQLVIAGYYLSAKKPYDQTDAELKKSQELLKSKKSLVRMFWSSETDLQNAFASGEVWIAYAWPADYVAMKAKKLPVVYMQPKEGALSWICGFMLGKSSPRVEAAHAYVDAWSSTQAGSWLETNYAYGAANTKARPSDPTLLKALQLDNPKSVGEPTGHIDRYIPRRALYSKLWDEVKAS
jgi:spermidine/putrescine transport system substrate-binding protein